MNTNGKPSRWPRIWLVVAALLGVAMGIGGYTFSYAEGLSYMSTDPAACVNCHIMQSQYEAWQKASISFVTQPLTYYERNPVWTDDPKHTPFKYSCKNMLPNGYAGTLGTASAGCTDTTHTCAPPTPPSPSPSCIAG